MRKETWPKAGALALACAALAAAGCGAADDSGSGGGAATGASTAAAANGADPAIQALVPADIRKKGEVTVATDGNYPPMEFSPNASKNLVGLEPDVQAAVFKLMGLKFKQTVVGFDSIVPGLQAKRFDVSFSGLWVTPERTKVVDMVSFFKSGSQYVVRADDTKGPINSLSDMCGRTAALQSGSYEVTWTQEASKKCKAAGKPPVKVQVYKTQDQATLALTTGRADSTGMGAEVAAYLVKQSKGKLKLAGDIFHETDGGLALPKGSPLAKAFAAAFQKIIDDGTYNRIFDRWGLVNSTVAAPKIYSGSA